MGIWEEYTVNEFVILEEIAAKIDKLPYASFLSTMTVVLENYCRRHGYNAIDEVDNLANMVRLADELLGMID